MFYLGIWEQSGAAATDKQDAYVKGCSKILLDLIALPEQIDIVLKKREVK